jgi:hypothetical protein
MPTTRHISFLMAIPLGGALRFTPREAAVRGGRTDREGADGGIGPALQADQPRRRTEPICAPMLGPLDWYSAIEIGIAAAVVVGIVVLISWLPGPPRG